MKLWQRWPDQLLVGRRNETKGFTSGILSGFERAKEYLYVFIAMLLAAATEYIFQKTRK